MSQTSNFRDLFSVMASFYVVVMLCNYENNGSPGYIKKGAGTRGPRGYSTAIFCALNIPRLFRDGYELFLTSNGVVVIYDDVPLRYFWMIVQYPHLSVNVFARATEVQHGTWSENITTQQKYAEYLSSDEISEYLDDNGQLVEWRLPRTIETRRRQTAWEFMGQETPARYIRCINKLFEGNRTASSSSLASAKVFDVEAEVSTMNRAEARAVKIIIESHGTFGNQDFDIEEHCWPEGVQAIQ